MSFPTDLGTGLSLNPNLTITYDTRDLVNPGTNNIEGARLINIATGDYVLNENGHFVGMNDIEQKVILAVLTTFNSASSPIGQRLRELKVINPTTIAQIQNYINQCLASLINGNYITLNYVNVVKPYSSALQIVVNWTNIYTQTTTTSNIPLSITGNY